MFRSMRKLSQLDVGRIFPKKAVKRGAALARDSMRRAGEADILTVASSLAFTTVLSIAPLLAVLFYVFKLFGGLDYAYTRLEPFLLDILSEGTGEVVAHHLGQFIRQVHAKAVGWVGITGLILTSIMTYFTVVRAFNKIWHVNKPRSFQHRVLRAITLITIGPVLLTASIVITTAATSQLSRIPFSGPLLAYALNVVLFAMVYALVPMVKVPLPIIFKGSIIPAALLELAKLAYALYTTRMVTYSNFYGSFAAIPLFLLWIYIAWCITLFGAVWVRVLQLRE
jgi:membrane protein